ncbi:MAG: hypothetical protein ACI4Q3_00040 [Kiritimatiellia bacterium]
MKIILSFFLANLPVSVIHFMLFVYVRQCHWLGHPGFWAACELGAPRGSVIWWAIMVVNSLFWGGCATFVIGPVLKKLVK